MQVVRHGVNGTGELGVGAELMDLGDEVVVCLGALELRRPILADQHERRQKDGLERDDECQLRPGVSLGEEHPRGKGGGVQVDERHRTGERRGPISHPQLHVRRSSSGVGDDDRVMDRQRRRNRESAALPPPTWLVDGGVRAAPGVDHVSRPADRTER